ncbi:MAG: sugar phosphate isomerase/epimerase family protein [Planctomycetota bacterium]
MQPAPRAAGPDRREFLTAAGAALVAAPLGRPGGAPQRRGEPLFPISLAEWSLHRTLGRDGKDNLTFPQRAKSFGIEAVEYVNSFFKAQATDAGYLRELRTRCDDAGVRSLLIMCDGEGALGDPDPARRAQAVQNHHKWIDAANALGCHSIRVNAQSQGSWAEQTRLAVDGLRRLCEYGDAHDCNVIVENHGGLSSNGKWLSTVLTMVDHPRMGALPDFGNFRVADGEDYDRYQGVAELMPFAKGVSAKSQAFDADGNETGTDYRRMLEIVVREHGWRGHVGIEYEGGGLAEDDGIRATLRLLERVREELGEGR